MSSILLNLEEMSELLNLPPSFIWRLSKEKPHLLNSNPFPKPVMGHGKKTAMWSYADVETWLARLRRVGETKARHSFRLSAHSGASLQ